MPWAIEAESVSKRFPESMSLAAWLKARGTVPMREVLEDVSLTVKRGEIFGLLGANGAGKTTLLKILATLVLPTAGRVRIEGVDTRSNLLAARRALGYVPADDRTFYYRLTARENLRFFGTMAGVPAGRLDAAVARSAAVVDLADDLDRRYAAYSTGMRQRLAVARALLADPPILLLDEPTRAVDPVISQHLRRTFAELASAGKAVVISTNQLDEAWTTCDRIAVMGGGRIVALDTPQRLRDRTIGARRYRVVVDRTDAELLLRLRSAAGVRSADPAGVHDTEIDMLFDENVTSMNAMLQAISSNGISVRRVEPVDPHPGEVFARLLEQTP